MPATFSIPLTGLAASDVYPGNYLEVSFAQGAASIGQGNYPVLFLGNRTTAGDATADTVIYGGPNSPLPLQTSQDAINRFGQGSELHRMIKRFLAVNTQSTIYAVAVTESVGAKATLPITFATAAAANGTARVFVGDEFVDVSITSGDTAIVIAGNAATQVNTKLDWAVTAANSGTAVLTITAKNNGLRGNWLRGSAVILGTGVNTTSSVTAQAFFTGGATADTSTTALATILPNRYYYIVSAAEDAAQLGALNTQVNSQATPLTGIRQRAYGGSIDTSGNATTIATGINSARMELIWGQNLDVTPGELAAAWAGCVSFEELPLNFRTNFNFYGNQTDTSTRWPIKAPKSGTSATRATMKTALNNGLTPVAVNANGTTAVVMRITTKSLTGSTNDYRIRAAHKVTVCDRYGDDLLTKLSLQAANKRIADDPVQGQRQMSSVVFTPRNGLALVNKLTDDYDGLDLLQNAATIKANTVCIREATPTTRMSVRIPLVTCDNLDQVATALDQTG